MKRKLLVILLVFQFLPMFGTSAGGMFYGNFRMSESFSNVEYENHYYYGGYGYGSSRDGVRYGGFGLVQFSENSIDDLYQGAYGGLITGREVVNGPIVIAFNLWTGIGHQNTQYYSGVSFLGEATGEVGLSIFPWFNISIYGGMFGTVGLSDLLDNGYYNPVVGIRFNWGYFK